MNWKMPPRSAGFESGRMIRSRMANEPQPSRMADSSSSVGMPRKNCTIMKMKNE